MPGKERETCPFFAKTGTCRFGERCSRGHPYPESSSILLFPGMYTHFELEQGLSEGYDTDLNLEYEDRELYHNFQEFYNDIVPEFKSVGKVIQVKVCCNYEPHLRGNVYVQYAREEDAAAALAKFNGRYYGGKQLNCEFVIIPKWNSAICEMLTKTIIIEKNIYVMNMTIEIDKVIDIAETEVLVTGQRGQGQGQTLQDIEEEKDIEKVLDTD
ncbi:hypothetical protein KUTeg_012538 [Tegillarca granosa]|uniref:Uncharacterized protein n=1 Tax=Tegillarca granosa TaxID=220873 RepID=A0ABQ9EZU7_TEGGR|nr:hypothetical protein KUTeg_012538 [Tegillarca granosa]